MSEDLLAVAHRLREYIRARAALGGLVPPVMREVAAALERIALAVPRTPDGNVAHGCEVCDGEDTCTCDRSATPERRHAAMPSTDELIEQFREAERLTGADLAVRINTRVGDPAPRMPERRADQPLAVVEVLAALKELRINANRLCDRNQGGTYEEDCRRSIARADAALKGAEQPTCSTCRFLNHWQGETKQWPTCTNRNVPLQVVPNFETFGCNGHEPKPSEAKS